MTFFSPPADAEDGTLAGSERIPEVALQFVSDDAEPPLGNVLHVASSRLITNAATKERLTLAGWVPARRGADDFLRHASKGTLC